MKIGPYEIPDLIIEKNSEKAIKLVIENLHGKEAAADPEKFKVLAEAKETQDAAKYLVVNIIVKAVAVIEQAGGKVDWNISPIVIAAGGSIIH